MEHVNRLAVGGVTLTVGWVVFAFVPDEWLKILAAVFVILGAAYVTGYAILRK